MNRSLALSLAALLSSAIVACGGPADEHSDVTSFTIPASASTRAELGVVEWSLDQQDREAPMEGRNSDGTVVVEFKHLLQKEATQRADAYVLQQGNETARVIIVDNGTTWAVTESSFE